MGPWRLKEIETALFPYKLSIICRYVHLLPLKSQNARTFPRRAVTQAQNAPDERHHPVATDVIRLSCAPVSSLLWAVIITPNSPNKLDSTVPFVPWNPLTLRLLPKRATPSISPRLNTTWFALVYGFIQLLVTAKAGS